METDKTLMKTAKVAVGDEQEPRVCKVHDDGRAVIVMGEGGRQDVLPYVDRMRMSPRVERFVGPHEDFIVISD